MHDYILAEQLCTDSVFSDEKSKSCSMIQVLFVSDIGQWLTENNLSACKEGAEGGEGGGAEYHGTSSRNEWRPCRLVTASETSAKVGNCSGFGSRKSQREFQHLSMFHTAQLWKWIYALIISTSKVNYSNVKAHSLVRGDPSCRISPASFDGWLLRNDGGVTGTSLHKIFTFWCMFPCHLPVNFSRLRRHAD